MLKLCILFISLLALSGCATQPKSVILNPIYTSGKVSQINTSMQANVIDHRITNFTIKVLNQEPAVYLPDASLPLKVQSAFANALTSNGATVITSSNRKITLKINAFHSKITESLTQHESNATADWQVIASHNNNTFEKRYTGQSKITGPLKHDQAKVETQLNGLIQKMLTRIVSDQALIDFLQGQ
ncbi:putative lipoprotein [Pseudoalteromonas citrea]|uniref:Lipoprotein n=2 Tax=Pseudoalteromonas citrea TaxID=43655 RepID=A0AAD4AJG9_9GAMM|nr:YajG family lipoprotein [Pseudoalteromonas citrea]KAF7772213.1 putative lipoprotein [Pseudoalteromonas citrea]